MVTCICQQCGQEFDESDLVIKHYKEYEGASTQTEHVSPCCLESYDYKP